MFDRHNRRKVSASVLRLVVDHILFLLVRKHMFANSLELGASTLSRYCVRECSPLKRLYLIGVGA